MGRLRSASVMRFTQNNSYYTQVELIIETSIILNTHHLYMENYFAFGNHISYGCTQAPLFYRSSVGNVLYNINNIKADILYFIFIIVF